MDWYIHPFTIFLSAVFSGLAYWLTSYVVPVWAAILIAVVFFATVLAWMVCHDNTLERALDPEG